ncbi:indolepyruvate oxidoreductase subunit beta family protein [Sphingobacterium daejeonense]|uniref:indolepyruvate oxidoreductase subunit beta family protein n=1 Tax=Sphingobacterium daejeonense TaxID=371142 RepID=UPI0021A4533E|nr:indolepyruvate oxidoreductase subunit beta family protein [Sphingobacterium daejeonense]MCT1531922.1 indolepyruvate oxidoreductase subunit beta family protein [Sphingobacterium daejeonense]
MMAEGKVIEPIKVALIAVGGDGGGVLTQWIVQLASKNGYWAQSTTIAGVAQRTGSTVYYLELFPEAAIPMIEGKKVSPVLAQMPAPEDVDVVMATELIEAGRAIQRGFVSKKTTLIFSTHRNLAIQEKEKPGDGILDGTSIFELSRKYAKTSVYANLKELADNNKSVISATLFGALAASNALPFGVEQFENTIKEGGVAVPTSLAAFKAAFGLVGLGLSAKEATPYVPELKPAVFDQMPETTQSKKLNEVLAEIRTYFPVQTHSVIFAGVKHVLEWGNVSWAMEYVNKLKRFAEIDKRHLDKQSQLTQSVARYLALAMAYDDLVNVADIKTRKERWETVFGQVGAKKGEIVKTTDYFHPRFEEVFGFMPVKLGRKLEKSESAQRFFTKYLDKDRRMNTHNVFWFTILYTIGGMKGYRKKTLRHAEEMANIDGWFDRLNKVVEVNYDLAVQLARTYRLKKGYGDTYARGHSKFKMLNEFVMKHQAINGIEHEVSKLIDYGLKNHEAEQLQGQIALVEAEIENRSENSINQ